VLEASHAYEGFFGAQVTAAGSQRPARVLVIGAGVAGLAAVAAARSLGAEVRAFGTRAAAREQQHAPSPAAVADGEFEDDRAVVLLELLDRDVSRVFDQGPREVLEKLSHVVRR
jgi:NAD/NADP transhydrogenase alpha subunit